MKPERIAFNIRHRTGEGDKFPRNGGFASPDGAGKQNNRFHPPENYELCPFLVTILCDHFMNLPEAFNDFIAEERLFTPEDRLLLAVSGGLTLWYCASCHTVPA